MERKIIAAGIVMIDKQTGDFLLGRRSYQSPHAGTFSPFGGKFETRDGNIKNTAKREFQEESGSDTEYEISKYPFHIQDDPNLTFYNFIGITDGKFPVSIDKEHITYGWFPLESLPSNLHPGFKDMLSQKKDELEEIIRKVKEKG